jgi:hypothetical protein
VKKQNKISFYVIKKDFDQIKILYDLLKKRNFNISHKNIPTFDEHKMFVINNPYRTWYLIKENNTFIGSFYIKIDNSVGINITNETQENIVSILEFIKKNFTPLPQEKSMVPNYFYINIPALNLNLQNILKIINTPLLQVSYKI